MTQRLTFPGFEIETALDWKDITDSIPSADKPFTLARDQGIGAVQFSPALYRGGPLPSPTGEELVSMAVDFGRLRSLGQAFDTCSFANRLVGGAASYHSDGDFIRVWYVSDRRSIMLATYVCEWASRGQEIVDYDNMVKTLRFLGPQEESAK